MMADRGLVFTHPAPTTYASPPRRKASMAAGFDTTPVSSSFSPNQSYQSASGTPTALSPGQDKSPLSTMNLGLLKTLSGTRSRDGQPPKRRGPKPDSKPALTRRQELNRQAQRTHRERKELYIKALEDEVLRLKEIYTNIYQDRGRLLEENYQLKALLAQNGMSSMVMSSGSGGGGAMDHDAASNAASTGLYTAGISLSGSCPAPPSSPTSAYTPPPLSAGCRGCHGQRDSLTNQHSRSSSGQGNSPAQQGRYIDLDNAQAGIDFVLTLEKPCMDHLRWLLERPGEASGHALMVTCPPVPFSELSTSVPFGHQQQASISSTSTRSSRVDSRQQLQIQMAGAKQQQQSMAPHKHHGHGACEVVPSLPGTWDLSRAGLATLLDLSSRLNLNGEITPVMAWGMVLGHPRAKELCAGDIARLTEELVGKIRCYGFGAVLEEFEVRDSLENLLSTKPEFGYIY